MTSSEALVGSLTGSGSLTVLLIVFKSQSFTLTGSKKKSDLIGCKSSDCTALILVASRPPAPGGRR